MARMFYLLVLMVLAEHGARADLEEHDATTDRFVALDESSVKLEAYEHLSFAEEPATTKSTPYGIAIMSASDSSTSAVQMHKLDSRNEKGDAEETTYL